MKVRRIVELAQGVILSGEDQVDQELNRAFSSDLMSDVLALGCSDILLITGLVNNQVIRTAEMADIRHILFVRNKSIPAEVVELAKSIGICVMQSPISMFHASGRMFGEGLKPVY